MHEDYKWPDVPRIAFRDGHPSHLNACLEWAIQQNNVWPYMEGYRRSASALVRGLESPMSPEILVFPVAFLWRHHIELGLKEIIAVGSDVNERAARVPAVHDLGKLWAEAKPLVAQCGDPEAPEVANVEFAIKEFMTIDPVGDTRRRRQIPNFCHRPWRAEYINCLVLPRAALPAPSLTLQPHRTAQPSPPLAAQMRAPPQSWAARLV
jgi:hypothetical protein